MIEHEHKAEKATISAPFTAEQESRIREIVDEQINRLVKQMLQERRFGTPFPPKEHK